jgi:hypothetical protein
MTTESNDQGTAGRSSTRTVLAATGIAVGSALLLGLTFGGGVLLGTHLPDRGPGLGFVASERLDRLHDRMADRRDARDDRRESWRDERGGVGD